MLSCWFAGIVHVLMLDHTQGCGAWYSYALANRFDISICVVIEVKQATESQSPHSILHLS